MLIVIDVDVGLFGLIDDDYDFWFEGEDLFFVWFGNGFYNDLY